MIPGLVFPYGCKSYYAGADQPVQVSTVGGALAGGCRRGSGKKHLCYFLTPLPATFHAGNFLSLLWFSYLEYLPGDLLQVLVQAAFESCFYSTFWLLPQLSSTHLHYFPLKFSADMVDGLALVPIKGCLNQACCACYLKTTAETLQQIPRVTQDVASCLTS